MMPSTAELHARSLPQRATARWRDTAQLTLCIDSVVGGVWCYTTSGSACQLDGSPETQHFPRTSLSFPARESIEEMAQIWPEGTTSESREGRGYSSRGWKGARDGRERKTLSGRRGLGQGSEGTRASLGELRAKLAKAAEEFVLSECALERVAVVHLGKAAREEAGAGGERREGQARHEGKRRRRSATRPRSIIKRKARHAGHSPGGWATPEGSGSGVRL